MNRRELITGLISFVAAPAIVRAGSLMPVKVIKPNIYFDAAETMNKILELEEYRCIYTEFVPIRLFCFGPNGFKVLSIPESDLYLDSLNELQ